MNSTQTLPSIAAPRSSSPLAPSPAAAAEVLQTRFALRIASRLTESCDAVSPDLAERLRFGREQALERARSARAAASPASPPHGRTAPGSRWASGWRLKLAGGIPVLALVGGLMLIQHWQDNAQISVAAEIDADLLSDDLPPRAYSDAGFVEYLKTPTE